MMAHRKRRCAAPGTFRRQRSMQFLMGVQRPKDDDGLIII